MPGDRGVLWHGAAPDVCVLWSYAEFDWRVGAQAKAFDVMASMPVELAGDNRRAQPWRVYLVQDVREL